MAWFSLPNADDTLLGTLLLNQLEVEASSASTVTNIGATIGTQLNASQIVIERLNAELDVGALASGLRNELRADLDALRADIKASLTSIANDAPLDRSLVARARELAAAAERKVDIEFTRVTADLEAQPTQRGGEQAALAESLIVIGHALGRLVADLTSVVRVATLAMLRYSIGAETRLTVEVCATCGRSSLAA